MVKFKLLSRTIILAKRERGCTGKSRILIPTALWAETTLWLWVSRAAIGVGVSAVGLGQVGILSLERFMRKNFKKSMWIIMIIIIYLQDSNTSVFRVETVELVRIWLEPSCMLKIKQIKAGGGGVRMEKHGEIGDPIPHF